MSKKSAIVIIGLATITALVLVAPRFLSGRRSTLWQAPKSSTIPTDELKSILPRTRRSKGTTPSRDREDILLPPEPSYPLPSSGRDDALDVDDRIYQKSSSFSVVASNVSKYITGLNDYFVSIRGRVLSSSINQTSKYSTAYLRVKVPVDKFGEANQKVRTDIKKIVYENVRASDETGSYVTATSNLEKLQEQKLEKELELEQTYDPVERKRLELEIQKLEKQIQTAQKKIQDIANRTNYATITVTAADNERYFTPNVKDPTDLLETFRQAWKALLGVLLVLVYFLIWIMVFSIIWLPIVFILKTIYSKFFKKEI